MMDDTISRRTDLSPSGSVGSWAPWDCREKISSSIWEASTGRLPTTATTRSTTNVVSRGIGWAAGEAARESSGEASESTATALESCALSDTTDRLLATTSNHVRNRQSLRL